VSAVSLSVQWIGKIALPVAVVFASAQRADAQVGLVSRESRVALVAHVPAVASIRDVGALRVLRAQGSVQEAKVTLRIASNGGYRLLVLGTPNSTESLQRKSGRIWVQGLDGSFQELKENSPVTVSHDRRHAGEWERDIVYRFETSGPADGIPSLPVRYEIAVNPSL
jgi:hypothetical protein